MNVVSAAALQAMMAQHTNEVFIACVTITHPSFAAPIRLAYNNEPVVRAAGTYLPYGFQLNLPSQRDDQLPSATITVDNTDLEVNRQIRSITGLPTVVLDVVLASSPDTVESGPYYYSMTSVNADASAIQGTLSVEEDMFNQIVPYLQYTPINSRGLFT